MRATPPPAPVREAIKTGKFDAVVFTSSSTVRNLVGIAGKPHASTIIAVIGPATARTCEEHGLRVDVIAAKPSVVDLADALASFAAQRRDALPGGRRAGPQAVAAPAPAPAVESDCFGDAMRPEPVEGMRPEPVEGQRSPGFDKLSPQVPSASGLDGYGPLAAMRAMVAETSLEPRQLILPMFVAEGLREPRPISSMPGVVQHTLDTLRKAAVEAADAGLAGVMLFGVPEHKDARGSGALDPNGILTAAIRAARQEVGDDCLVMSDVCLDEFTDHGHCGVLTPSGTVDNDATIEIYAQMAVLHAEAGSHMVGPSGMMDGQVGVIRKALDASGAADVAILAYSAKYASAFYGPFREAVGSSLKGNRRTYQQDPANVREALREVALDVEQGADIVMVKPALGYLDVVRAVREAVDLPVAAYNVSGEYAMVEAAAANGWINRDAVINEALTSIRRAGADVILSYWAMEWATRLRVQ